MTKEEVERKSSIICQRILNSTIYKESNCIYCYYPIQNEVDIMQVIVSALENGKTVALPKVINKQGEMIFSEIQNLDNLITGHFNIPEPITTAQAKKQILFWFLEWFFQLMGKGLGRQEDFMIVF